MRREKRIMYWVIVVIALLASYFYVANKRTPVQVPPEIIKENPPVVEMEQPKQEEPSIPIEKKTIPASPPPAASEKIERPSSVSTTPENTVNLQEQSYSIHKEKKEIAITPGVALQPGKSINIKVGEDIIKVGRDKVYHPGGYNVLWEKKY